MQKSLIDFFHLITGVNNERFILRLNSSQFSIESHYSTVMLRRLYHKIFAALKLCERRKNGKVTAEMLARQTHGHIMQKETRLRNFFALSLSRVACVSRTTLIITNDDD
jgi:hypothetical protein